MNLTISLRKKLLISVLKDQLSEEFENLQERIKLDVNRLSDELNDGMFNVAIEALKESGYENPNACLKSYNYGVIDDIEKSPTRLLVDAKSSLFRLSITVKIQNPHLIQDHWSDTVHLKADSKARNLSLDIRKFYSKSEKLMSDLTSVLNSFKTVKKLQEVTNVFDPFLPSLSKSTYLLPVDTILRVNELKSPKKRTVKAA